MELREGYKQTEVGVIPEDWDIQKLGKICTFSTGRGLLKGDILSSGSIPAIPYTSLYTDFSEILGYEKIKWFVNDAINTQIVDEPCVLIAMSSNMEVNTGKASALTESAKVAIGREVIILKSKCDPAYVSYLLSTDSYRKRTLALARGTTIKHVYTATFYEYPIAVPTRAEQEAIANALSDADALIQSLAHLIVKKRQIKQGAMQTLLNPYENGRLKSGWVVKRLEDIADVIDPHPSHRAPPVAKSGIPFVGIGDLSEDGALINSKARIVSEDIFYEHNDRYNLNDGLLGLGRVASIGKVVSLKNTLGKYAISPTLGIIKGNKVGRDYLRYILNSRIISDQFAMIMSGSTRSSVGMIVLRKLNIPLPTLPEEQNRIATILSDMDADITALETKLRNLCKSHVNEIKWAKQVY